MCTVHQYAAVDAWCLSREVTLVLPAPAFACAPLELAPQHLPFCHRASMFNGAATACLPQVAKPLTTCAPSGHMWLGTSSAPATIDNEYRQVPPDTKTTTTTTNSYTVAFFPFMPRCCVRPYCFIFCTQHKYRALPHLPNWPGSALITT